MAPTWLSKYRSLSPKTRIAAGVSIMAYATIALYLSDIAEEPFGLKAGEKEREELGKYIPKVRTIDRNDWQESPGQTRTGSSSNN